MSQTDIVSVAAQAAQKSKNLVGQQVDRQASALGATLLQTARDLQQVGSNLRDSGMIGGAAQLADWAADYVTRAGEYLTNGHTDRFIHDLETFSRDRPWAIAASAGTLGFLAARVVKSSSARRYQASAYDSSYGSTGAAADYVSTGAAYPTGVPSAPATSRYPSSVPNIPVTARPDVV